MMNKTFKFIISIFFVIIFNSCKDTNKNKTFCNLNKQDIGYLHYYLLQHYQEREVDILLKNNDFSDLRSFKLMSDYNECMCVYDIDRFTSNLIRIEKNTPETKIFKYLIKKSNNGETGYHIINNFEYINYTRHVEVMKDLICKFKELSQIKHATGKLNPSMDKLAKEYAICKMNFYINDTAFKKINSEVLYKTNKCKYSNIHFIIEYILFKNFYTFNCLRFYEEIYYYIDNKLFNVRIINNISSFENFKNYLQKDDIGVIPFATLNDCDNNLTFFSKANVLIRHINNVSNDNNYVNTVIDSLNKKYLLSKLEYIRNNINNSNYVYFYSLPDLKLIEIKLIKDEENNKFSIMYRFINNGLFWENIMPAINW